MPHPLCAFAGSRGLALEATVSIFLQLRKVVVIILVPRDDGRHVLFVLVTGCLSGTLAKAERLGKCGVTAVNIFSLVKQHQSNLTVLTLRVGASNRAVAIADVYTLERLGRARDVRHRADNVNGSAAIDKENALPVERVARSGDVGENAEEMVVASDGGDRVPGAINLQDRPSDA
jgi:hypothetical protein